MQEAHQPTILAKKVRKPQPTRQELKDSHKARMAERRRMYRITCATQPTTPHIFANISKHHEFYGDTPSEHEARKIL